LWQEWDGLGYSQAAKAAFKGSSTLPKAGVKA
jgi:hypothetical protein